MELQLTVNVLCVPAKVGDTTVVVASVQHDQVEKTADAESSPDTKVVVHVNLTNGHVLEISLLTDCQYVLA